MFNMGINWAKEKTRARIEGHWKLFRELWKQYARLCKELPFTVPTVLEWPRSNAYWKEQEVVKLLAMNGMVYTDFDGCQYGLKDSKGKLFLRKPWRFATNIPGITDLFSRLCTGEHQHGSTCGKEAIHSQYYTPTMAILIHKAIADLFFSPGASGPVAEELPCSSPYEIFVHKYGNVDSHRREATFKHVCKAIRMRARPFKGNGILSVS